MKIKLLPRVDRPREKLEKYGAEKLSHAELLAILLRSGAKGVSALDLARAIVRKFSGNTLAGATIADLKKHLGVGTAKACEIVACFELGRRFLQNKKSALFLSPRDVWEALPDTRASKKEHFAVFFLDARNQEIKREIISVGTLSANLVHPREVFEPAIVHSAAHLIIAHNHPSGNPEPSKEDIEVTKRLKEAGTLLGIEVLDHVVVSKGTHFSFKEKRLL